MSDTIYPRIRILVGEDLLLEQLLELSLNLQPSGISSIPIQVRINPGILHSFWGKGKAVAAVTSIVCFYGKHQVDWGMPVQSKTINYGNMGSLDPSDSQ